MFHAARFIDEQIAALRKTVDRTAVIAVSGGVDSATAAAIAAKAVGEKLLAVYVDTGLMREGESVGVEGTLRDLGIRHVVVRAEERFFGALAGVEDPEKKRHLIGNLFVRIFEEEAAKVGAVYLVQGTIAPDWIESGGALRDRIKSHHNVGGLPEVMALKLAEPLRDLYKDEVRKVARALGLRVAERQPFPGPALAVRCLGEVTLEKVEVVRGACAIVEEEIETAAKAGTMTLPWQYFAVLLPIRSVGVHGDVRVYGWTVAVRAIESVDGMSGRYSRIPHDVLERMSVRITNELPDVNRVVYDVTNKPPATIEWE